MIQSEDEPLIVVKPPSLLVEKKYLRRDVYTTSPKKPFMDSLISTFHIQGEHSGKLMNFHLEPLQSEPNLWKLLNSDDLDDGEIYGIMMASW